MGKLKFTLSNILLYVALIATCLILEDVGFLSSNPTGPLSNAHFFMFFTLAMGCYISYFLIDHIKNKVTLDYVLVPLFMICFICGCLSIWQFSGFTIANESNLFEYNVSNWDKVIQSLSLVSYLLAVYSILFYFNKNHPSIRKLRVAYLVIALIALTGTVYSWIRDFDAIKSNLSGITPLQKIQSFFWHPNMFSLMLLLGIFSCFGLNYYKKNFIIYLLIVYFLFMICVVGSLTSIIISFVSVVVYFLIEIIVAIRRNIKLGLLNLTIYLLALSSIIIVVACSLNFDFPPVSSFFKSLFWNFSRSDFHTFTSRILIWNYAISYSDSNLFGMIFGVGFKNSYHVIGGYYNVFVDSTYTTLSAHSGYLQILLNFGVIGLLVYLLFFCYFVYSFVRILKKDLHFALVFGLIGIALLGYAVTESVIFMNPNSTGLLIAAFFYLPIMNKWKHYKHPRLGDDVIEVCKPKSMPISSISKSLAKLFMALIAVTAAMFIFPLFRENRHGMYLLVNIIVLLFICALFVPFIISCIAKNHSRKAATILSTVNFLIVASPVVYLALRYYLHHTWFSSGAEWILPVMVILILVGEALIFGVGKRMKFRHYLSTLVGMSKNSFMGLIGVAIIVVAGYFTISYLDIETTLTYIIYPVIALVAFYLASYLVPFKDQKAFISSYNESLLYSLKLEVLKDRLGDYNEKRRD